MSRLLIIPDEKFQALVPDFKARLLDITRQLRPEHVGHLLESDGAFIASTLANDEDSREFQIWARSPTGFVIVWSSKGKRDVAVGTVTAELGRGLINQVFESARAEAKSGGYLNASDWTNFETKRGASLLRMAACPITVFGLCAGVLSLSQFAATSAVESIGEEETQIAGTAASLASRLIEDRLVRACLGLSQV